MQESESKQKFELAGKYFISFGKDRLGWCGRVISKLGPETYCIEPVKSAGKPDRKITIKCHRMNGWFWYESEEQWKDDKGYFESEYINDEYQKELFLEAKKSGVPIITFRDEPDNDE